MMPSVPLPSFLRVAPVAAFLILAPRLAEAQADFALFSVKPSVHSTEGGTLVHLDGVGFDAETEVLVGSTVLEGVAVASSGRLTAVMPAMGSGTYDVTARRPGGTEAVLRAAVSFHPARFPGVVGLTCTRWYGATHVSLSWQNPIAYDRIDVFRGKDVIASLAGTATSHIDPDALVDYDAKEAIPYSVIAYLAPEEPGGDQRRSYSSECASHLPRPRPQLIEFATLRAGAGVLALRGSTPGSASGDPARTFFRLTEEGSGVQLRIHGRRLVGDAELKARIFAVSDPGQPVASDLPLRSEGVLGDASWFVGAYDEDLPLGEYLLEVYAVAEDPDRAAFILSTDASIEGHPSGCGPYPLAKVEPIDSRKGLVQLGSFRQLGLHPDTAALAGPEDGAGAASSAGKSLRNAVQLRIDVDDPEGLVDRYRWTFSDGSEAETTGPELLHSLLRPGVHDVLVRALRGDREMATLDGRVAAGGLDFSFNAPDPGEPPGDPVFQLARGNLDDLTLISGHTAGVRLTFICGAVPANFARIDSISMVVSDSAGDFETEVVEREVYHFRQENGAWMGMAVLDVILPDVETGILAFHCTFTDTKGKFRTIADRALLCDVPPPFDQEWVGEEVTGGPRSGYTLVGSIPADRPVWSETVTIPVIDYDLRNRFDPYITARMDLRERTWFPQSIEGGLDVELFNIDILSEPIIHIEPPDDTALGIACNPVAIRYRKEGMTDLFRDAPTCIPLLDEVPIWELGIAGINAIEITASVSACVGFDVSADVDLTFHTFTPDASLTFRPEIIGSLPASGRAEALFGLASLDIWLTPSVSFELPVHVDYDAGTQDLDYDIDWCLEATLSGKAKACVFWKVCYSKSATLISEDWGPGCGKGHGARLGEEPYHSRAPALASSPSGATAIMVEVANRDSSRETLNPYLVYRVRQKGGAFSSPEEMFDGASNRAFVKDPSVAFLDEKTAVAVWAQSSLGEEDIPRLSGGGISELNEILLSYDIFYSILDGSTWSEPRAVQKNVRADGLPSVVAAGDGVVAVTWVQADGAQVIDKSSRIDLASMSVWAAFIDAGGQVFQPIDVSGDAAGRLAADIQPAVAFSSAGDTGELVWIRDLDGDLRTPDDRSIMSSTYTQGGWSSPLRVTNPKVYPGVLEPSISLRSQSTGVVAATLPSTDAATAAIPVIDAGSRILAIELAKSGFGVPRILGEGTCGFEAGLPGCRPEVLFLDLNTAVVMFRPGVELIAKEMGSGYPALAMAVAPFARGMEEISPVRMVRVDEGNLPIDFSMARNANGGLDVALDDLARPEVLTFKAEVAPDLTITDIRLADPHAPPGSLTRVEAVVTNSGATVAVGSSRVGIGLYDGPDFIELAGVDMPVALGAGESTVAELTLLHPEEFLELWVVVAPLTAERVTSNNRGMLTLGIPAPTDLECRDATSPTGPPAVLLRWANHETYDEVVVERDGALVATVSGGRTAYVDGLAPPGRHEWSVRGVVRSGRSAPSAACEATIRIPSPGGTFRRADTNADGAIDISDAVAVLGYLFLGGAVPSCLQAADSNGDDQVDISDASFTLGYLFLGGGPVPPPFEQCGSAPASALSCDRYAPCGR